MSWFDGWEHIPADRGQPRLEGGAPKLGVHTTQGWAIEHAVSTYRQRDGWPNFTVDPWARRKAQHYPFGIATSRGFRASTDGWSANRWNCQQVEIVGWANGAPELSASDRRYLIGQAGYTDATLTMASKPASLWPDEVLEWLAREVFAPILWFGGIPATTPVPWPAQRRLTRQEWIDAAGIVGHAHCPDQDHTDPGGLNVYRILQLIAGTPAPPPPPRRRPRMLCIVRDGNVTLYGAGRPVNLGGLPGAYNQLTGAGVPTLHASDPQVAQLQDRLEEAALHPSAAVGPMSGTIELRPR